MNKKTLALEDDRVNNEWIFDEIVAKRPHAVFATGLVMLYDIQESFQCINETGCKSQFFAMIVRFIAAFLMALCQVVMFVTTR